MFLLIRFSVRTFIFKKFWFIRKTKITKLIITIVILFILQENLKNGSNLKTVLVELSAEGQIGNYQKSQC